MRADFPQPHYGFVKSWKRAGSDSQQKQSEIDTEKSAADIAFCIKNLTLKYPQPPRKTLRIIQIIECMKAQGWELQIEEIVITT